jgi:hypothetical protein
LAPLPPKFAQWLIVFFGERAMAKKQAGPSKITEASSAMGPIARGLIQDFLGPDRRVIDMDRFITALMQALHDAYAQGWKDREQLK